MKEKEITKEDREEAASLIYNEWVDSIMNDLLLTTEAINDIKNKSHERKGDYKRGQRKSSLPNLQ